MKINTHYKLAQLTIAFDEGEIQALSNICEAARIYLERERRSREDPAAGPFCAKEVGAMETIWR